MQNPVSISVSLDEAPLQGLVKRLHRLGPLLLGICGAALHNALLEHFRARQSEPRRDRLTPRGFWYGTNGDSVAERTLPPVADSTSVRVAIQSPALAHKADPSPPPILPKGGRRFLAIPASDSANLFPGMPRDYPGLRFGLSPFKGSPRPALLDKGRSPVYWLCRRVQTPHDPAALPSRPLLVSALLSSLRSVSNLP